MTYVIVDACVDVKDKACIDECPVDCIYEGARMLYINPDECVDCAACEPVCPVDAIYFDQNVPEELSQYTQYNIDFFEELGSPGGASRLGVLDHDPTPIKSIPTRESD
ncbi:ferredoxin family protein [Mycolicibacterium fluoranthenivorans]|uniref:Ferredoxin n=1 Tax=Mycolicibacterium fluoranthenivorans TaxID=258505 RepID=A0A7G8P6X2_9MYCO|nr:ferredoxin [Mycolicibacterium fluoranthenivorans]QNJ90088.1 ferredoxin family protein [Mycolicibacterium fluoranthenivorans]